MAHELWNIKNNVMTNITPLIGSISWKSNTIELGERLDFDIAFNDGRFFPINLVDVGNLVILKNKDEIMRGIVVTENRQGRGAIVYIVYDYAFYLNKSSDIYQFNKVSGKKAIEKICSDYSVPIGSIAAINTIIDKIYNERSVSDIIKDILSIAEKETGVKYRMEMRLGKLYIEPYKNLVIKATFKLAENIAESNVLDAISAPMRRRSIEDMKNSIKLINDEKVVVEVKNDSLIKQYGLLREVVSIDDKDIAQARNIAQNMLKDLGRVLEENSIEVPGDDRVRAGRILEITEPVTGMKGQYLIADATHTLQRGIHKMVLGLEVV